MELIRRTREKDLQKAREGEGEKESRVSPEGTIRESFGVSIGVLVQVDSCDSETHCPVHGGSEFLILNKIDLAPRWPGAGEILTVAANNSEEDSIFEPNWKTYELARITLHAKNYPAGH